MTSRDLALNSPGGASVAPARHQAIPSWRWVALCWLAVIVLGTLQAWDVQHGLDPDGVAYLDMGDAFFRGNWRLALNGVWPPLYAFLIGLTQWVIRPPARLEIVVLHALNLIIYLVAYACFLFLLVELVRYQRWSAERRHARPGLPNEVWLVLGTAIFLWSALRLITVPQETPDMAMTALVYVASGLLLRIRSGEGRWGTFGLLGVVLGLAYLSKYFMFEMAPVFILVAAAAYWPRRQALAQRSPAGESGGEHSPKRPGGLRTAALPAALAGGLLAVAAFLAVSGPFIVALSVLSGRPTTNNGTVYYLMHIYKAPFVNWQGGPAGAGTALHPTQKLFDKPSVYAFAGMDGETYPPWDDPGYWMATSGVRFKLSGHVTALLEAASLYFDIFMLAGGALLAGCLMLYALAGAWRASLRALVGEWVLLLPALAALGLFALIHAEPRYTGPFAALVWLGAISGAVGIGNEGIRPVLVRVAIVTALVVTLVAGLPPALSSIRTAREWLRGRNPQPPDQWDVAVGLHALGVSSGDKIAFMGNTFRASAWARLARVRIVAEIPSDEAEAFWALDEARQAEVFDLLARSGAEVLVTKYLPDSAPSSWQRLGQTDYYAYWLQ